MASTTPETLLQQAHNRARQFLDTNNSLALTAKYSDEMISLLEAGEGSFYLRDQLDHVLHNIVLARGLANCSQTYEWAKLRQLFSFKDKISYVTAVMATDNNNSANTNLVIGEDDVKTQLHDVIGVLENDLLSSQEFTESWILRHAAINRFACHLDTKEKTHLNTFAIKVKELCSNEGFDILAEVVHFTFESDAQKIIKINEIFSQLSAMGTQVPAGLLEEFGAFEKHIEKIKNLDESYKHLAKTLNMIHKVAKTTDKSMISPKKQKIVTNILEELGLKDTIEKSITDFNDPTSFSKNEENTYLDKLLHTVRQQPKYQEIVEKYGLQENTFDENFSSWIGFRLTHGAHTALATQKGVTFGADLPAFEQDTQSWRGMMRQRIFEVYDRNATRHGAASRDWDFDNDPDFDLMNSYFTKFPDLFFAKDEDNYRTVDGLLNANNVGPDNYELHFDKMRSILAAIIRRKTPALRSSDRIKRGSYGKIMLDRVNHAFKGKDRGIFNMIERAWDHTDDASIIAMTIMLKNNATNKMFYENTDPFEKKERWYSKIFKSISGFERGREAISKTFAPVANTGLKGVENLVKGTVYSGAWIGEKGASIASTGLEKYHNWLSTTSNRNPLKLGMIATKPMEWLFKPFGKGFSYTTKDGTEKKIKITDGLSKGYSHATDALKTEKDIEEKKTKYLFEGLTRGIGKISSFFGKSVADSGQWMYDSYITNQQQNILGAFYDAAHREKWYNDLMTSSDIANALNLEVRGPKLFDEDGRILPVDKKEADPEDIKQRKELEKTLQDQLTLLQKGIADQEELLLRKIESTQDTSEQESLFQKRSRLDSRKGDISRITLGLRQLTPLLKNPPMTQNNQNQNQINATPILAIIGQTTTVTNNNNTTTVTHTANSLKANLQAAITTARGDRDKINDNGTPNLGTENAIVNRNNKNDLFWEINNAETIIDAQKNIIAQNQGNGNNGQNAVNRANAQSEINRQEAKIKDARTRIKELNQELVELSSWEAWLTKVASFVGALCDDNNELHFDETTFKALRENLDLTFYKPAPSQNQTINLTNTALSGALAA